MTSIGFGFGVFPVKEYSGWGCRRENYFLGNPAYRRYREAFEHV